MADQVTFKDLSTRRKVEHIWEYYKWYMGGTLLGLFFIVSILVTVFSTPQAPNKVNLIITGVFDMDNEVLEQTKENVYQSYEAGIYTIPGNWHTMDGSTASNEQLLSVKIYAKECDIIAEPMIRYETFKQIEGYDVFAKLDQMPALAPILEQYEDKLVRGISEEDGQEYVYGIQVDSLKGIEGVTLYEELILSILAVPNDKDAAIAFMISLLE